MRNFFFLRLQKMQYGSRDVGAGDAPPHPNHLGDQFFLQPTLLTIDEPQLLIQRLCHAPIQYVVMGRIS